MTKILLTGGTGYIGSHIAASADKVGYETVLYDNFSNSNCQVLDFLKIITGKSPNFVEGDVRNTELLCKTIHDQQITAVIHLAGLKSVEESVNNPSIYWENNIDGSKSLVRAMQENNLFRLIFSSSATVYGEPLYLPIDENHKLAPINPYAESKFQVEHFLEAVSREDARWKILNLRYFNPVGSHESGLLGDNAKALKANLVPMIARVLSGQRANLQIYGNDYDTPDGTCLRDYIHILDLADGHVMALNYLANLTGCDALNLGTGKGISVLELIAEFEAITGQKIPVEISSRRPGDVPVCFANCEKAERVIGWKATRSLKEICESTWHWCQKFDS